MEKRLAVCSGLHPYSPACRRYASGAQGARRRPLPTPVDVMSRPCPSIVRSIATAEGYVAPGAEPNRGAVLIQGAVVGACFRRVRLSSFEHPREDDREGVDVAIG